MLFVGKREFAKHCRKPAVALAAIVAGLTVLLAATGDVQPLAARDGAKPDVGEVSPCCTEIVAATPVVFSTSARFAAASRWRVSSRFLPAGVASEKGLQVRTILVARTISADFPQIHQIAGVRPDALRWHPNGLALDVMVPSPNTAAGIALGNQIVAFVLGNAARLGIQDAIWRGTYYTPDGGQRAAAGHYDHVHITTTGGGYPTGEEIYLR